ncbi:glycosyltransferase family A protein [Nocardioides bruguierae]|uniref:Glycosyltransferase n=1 Tax=Nocardioides bruguierae TaxID=2945102 RepID=A0A9X2IFP8_9ACTN|nr:glycosyltransferase family 2 protein [Nocardioides bruguierae]MCM0619945.1 glycosyltransferase [Nocardioides bruguierae]
MTSQRPAASPAPEVGPWPGSWPSVGVVVPTGGTRPHLLRRALDSVAAQDYPGEVRVVVVHDRVEPDTGLVSDGPRPVDVAVNTRTPGLAGTRNTGILAIGTDYVAFLDDDDHWLPGKLTAQVRRATAEDRPAMVTASMRVDFDGVSTPRLLGTDAIDHTMLTRNIVATAHSSGMLFDRAALVERIGLVSEDIPGSQNEDWDVKLRAARLGPIAHVDEPLVVVDWNRTSHYARSWDTKIASWDWMLAHHPEIARDRRASARVHGQLAFAEAARGRRVAALRHVARAVVGFQGAWRSVVTLAVVAGARPDAVIDALHRRGRGL